MIKQLIEKFERYLLRTGKFKWYCAWWLQNKYAEDLIKLLQHYNAYRSIEEGLNPYHTFEIMRLSHGWSYDYYYRLSLVMFYLGWIQEVPTAKKHRDCPNYVRCVWPQNEARKEVLHG